MDTQLKRYARKLVEEQLGQSRLQLAQIADDISFVKTQQQEKYSDPRGFEAQPYLTRFKIMICGVHPPEVDPRSLPWAYPAFSTSGLRGESLGDAMLPIGTFVYVSRETQTGEYFIERIAPNITPNLPLVSGSPYGARSGFDPTNTAYVLPDTLTQGGGDSGNSRILGGEVKGNTWPSLADKLQNTPRDDAKWQFPTLDASKNTVGGMAAAMEDSIKDVERLKRGLIGQDSILRQNLETLENAEKSVDAISAALKKQTKLISSYINTLMKKAQKKVLRMINQKMNKITAEKPLSGKFSNNDLITKAIKASSCAFNLAVSEMPNMVGQGLMGIINKAVNTSSCLIENFISNFIGQVVGQLSALIEGAMGTISNVLGGATDVLGSIGDVLDSIMNILNCEVTPQAGDPVVKEWNLLDGGSPVKITLNTDNIFNKAKKVGETIKDATKVPTNLGDYEYKFDPSKIAEDVKEACGAGGEDAGEMGGALGPIPCGPPSVTFWGGKGSGAKGNPVISPENGELMGVDIVDSGNYTQAPYVHVSDECGGGKGAVLEAVLGDVATDDPIEDFTGTVEIGANTIDNFIFAPLIDGLEPSDLIGKEVRVDGDDDILPADTVITDIQENRIILSNSFNTGAGGGFVIGAPGDILEEGSFIDRKFRIVGADNINLSGITTFDVSVKNNRSDIDQTVLDSKFVVDNVVQRPLCSDGYTLERGKTYHFDQSSPTNALVLKVGTDPFELVRGEDVYEIDTFWYEDVKVHPFRFSTKPDGIHNCDDPITTIVDPEEWPLSKDILTANGAALAWVLTNTEQGWSPFLQQFGRYPDPSKTENERGVVHEGLWEVDITEEMGTGTYTFEMQADNEGTISFDGVYIGKTDPIPALETQSIVQTESINNTHPITFVGVKPDGILRVTDTYLQIDDNPGNGFDTNATITITSGDAIFSADGRSIIGSGIVKLKLEWADVSSSGWALDSFTIEDITWVKDHRVPYTSKQPDAIVEQSVNLVDTVTTTDVIVYGQGIDLARGPHRVSKFLEVEVVRIGKHDILATIQNTTKHKTGVNLPDWDLADANKNPAALAWVLRKGPKEESGGSGEIIVSSNSPFKTTTTIGEPTNCGEEYTDGVTKVGEPGKPKSYVEIKVADNAPDTLYYYCENHPEMGGKICIIDGILPGDVSCRNAEVVVTDIAAPEGFVGPVNAGRVTAIRLRRGGTGYMQGTTNLLTEGGSGTSLTFNIVGATEEGVITAIEVSNGGKGYKVNDVITPICNFGGKVPAKTGIGVTQVLVKETGYGYKPWYNGDWGGMGRTWADRCQTIVLRANGDWDIPYTYGQVATLYEGDCIRFPAEEEICIDENFTENMIPGSTIIREEILPKDMSDLKWGGVVGGGEVGIILDASTRDYEDAIPDPENPLFIKPDGYQWKWRVNPETNERERYSLLRLYAPFKAHYVERIDGTNPDFPAGVAQWFFYIDGEYAGTVIQDTLSDIPQLVKTQEGLPTKIYRVAGYQENVEIPVTIDLPEWQHVASDIRRLDSQAWVLNDSQGWSPFLKTYGVFPLIDLGHGPGKYDELADVPKTGRWAVEITDEIQSDETANYYFEVQADNQGSITFDGIFLGSTTVFRSHNDSTFFEVTGVTKGTHIIEGTILNSSHPDGRKGWENNPAALGWVMRQGDMPDRQLVTETSTVLREQRDQDHDILYTGMKVPGDVQFATPTLIQFDDDSSNGFDVNAKLEILSGEAVFVRNSDISGIQGDNTCHVIRGTGAVTLRYSWTDNPRTSGQVMDFLTIEGVKWDQGDSYSGDVTATVTLVDIVTTYEDQVRTESYVTIGGDGKIVASSLDPFKNETEMVESTTRTLFGLNIFTSKSGDGRDIDEPVFTCDRDYLYAKTLGFSDCDIRNFLETSGMAVDKCMEDKLGDEDWGRCGDFKVLVTAPDCPERGGECPPGYYFDNGVCREDPCPPGEHWDPQQQTCVPDECSVDTDCPEGKICMNGKCIDPPPTIPYDPPPGLDGCPPGQRKVNGVCTDYDGGSKGCPPGQHKENGICVSDDCPPGYMKDPAGSGKCIPIVPPTCPPSDTYRVIPSLEEIIVANPGFGYNCCEDTVVIEPANGAEAVIEECDGRILSIRVTKGGEGFRELPTVHINTKTGLNAFLIPILKFNKENFDKFPEGTAVTQVVDCVGNVEPGLRTRVI